MVASLAECGYIKVMVYEQIDRYIIKGQIGKGGMARVYKGHDPHFQRDVAIKVMPKELLKEGTYYERFMQEARIVAALEHPAIVPVYDFGEIEGQPFMIMRYMSGGSLEEKLDEGALPLMSAHTVLSRISPALDEAHNQGIIHRDIKPENILFDKRNDAHLSDFGIAKLMEAGETLTLDGIVGTPMFMSPEQILEDAEIDHKSDIYALGLLLFEMLTGEPPYKSENPMELINMHLNEPPPEILSLNSALPPAMQTIINISLAKDPAERYATASELVQAYWEVIGGVAVVPEDGAALDGESTVELPPEGKLIHTDGVTFNLDKTYYSIGRHPDTDICLHRWDENLYVSKWHAELIYRSGGWFVVPNPAARNPTRVNGVPIPPGEETEIQDGDQVRFAGVIFTYRGVRYT